jgi:hypothetical protein
MLVPVDVNSTQLGLQFLVIHEDAKTITYTKQVGVVLGQLVDGLHLFFQKVLLQIVGKMWVTVNASHLVQIQQRLLRKIIIRIHLRILL